MKGKKVWNLWGWFPHRNQTVWSWGIDQSINESIKWPIYPSIYQYQSIYIPFHLSIYLPTLSYPYIAQIFELLGQTFSSQICILRGTSESDEAKLTERWASLVMICRKLVCHYLSCLSRSIVFSFHSKGIRFLPIMAIRSDFLDLTSQCNGLNLGRNRLKRMWKSAWTRHEQTPCCLQADFMVQMLNYPCGSTSWGSCPWTSGGGDLRRRWKCRVIQRLPASARGIVLRPWWRFTILTLILTGL